MIQRRVAGSNSITRLVRANIAISGSKDTPDVKDVLGGARIVDPYSGNGSIYKMLQI
jgi:hypothetical protein